jgi:hypothetical protein
MCAIYGQVLAAVPDTDIQEVIVIPSGQWKLESDEATRRREYDAAKKSGGNAALDAVDAAAAAAVAHKKGSGNSAEAKVIELLSSDDDDDDEEDEHEEEEEVIMKPSNIPGGDGNTGRIDGANTGMPNIVGVPAQSLCVNPEDVADSQLRNQESVRGHARQNQGAQTVVADSCSLADLGLGSDDWGDLSSLMNEIGNDTVTVALLRDSDNVLSPPPRQQPVAIDTVVGRAAPFEAPQPSRFVGSSEAARTERWKQIVEGGRAGRLAVRAAGSDVPSQRSTRCTPQSSGETRMLGEAAVDKEPLKRGTQPQQSPQEVAAQQDTVLQQEPSSPQEAPAPDRQTSLPEQEPPAPGRQPPLPEHALQESKLQPPLPEQEPPAPDRQPPLPEYELPAPNRQPPLPEQEPPAERACVQEPSRTAPAPAGPNASASESQLGTSNSHSSSSSSSTSTSTSSHSQMGACSSAAGVAAARLAGTPLENSEMLAEGARSNTGETELLAEARRLGVMVTGDMHASPLCCLHLPC